MEYIVHGRTMLYCIIFMFLFFFNFHKLVLRTNNIKGLTKFTNIFTAF